MDYHLVSSVYGDRFLFAYNHLINANKMNEIKVFHKSTFLDKEIDVWNTAEEPLFRASDVANWLSITNARVMVTRLDQEEVRKLNLRSRQGETWFLTEDGLYEALMQSRKPIAKQFKKGVKEILKSIRTTGGYIATTAADTPEAIMARALKIADETLKRNEQRMRELEAQTQQQAATIGLQKKELTVAAPKVDYYDNTLASVNYITATQVADDLGISARALNKKLAEVGLIYFQSGQWHVKGVYKGWSLASTRTHTYQNSNGENVSKPTLVWNQRGKRFILALYNNDFNIKAAVAEIKGESDNTPTLSNDK